MTIRYGRLRLIFVKADLENNKFALLFGRGFLGFDTLAEVNPFEVMSALE